jgi:hypothetical protein
MKSEIVSVERVDVRGKRVFLAIDLNVAMQDEKVVESYRIERRCWRGGRINLVRLFIVINKSKNKGAK